MQYLERLSQVLLAMSRIKVNLQTDLCVLINIVIIICCMHSIALACCPVLCEQLHINCGGECE